VKILLAAILMAMSQGAAAQTIADEPGKAPAANSSEPKKVEPKKIEAKKPAPPKKPAAPKGPKPVKAPPAPKVYRNSASTTPLRDKDGNVIPTNPDAYDVSSATGKKK
jgi:hypothetical protein